MPRPVLGEDVRLYLLVHPDPSLARRCDQVTPRGAARPWSSRPRLSKWANPVGASASGSSWETARSTRSPTARCRPGCAPGSRRPPRRGPAAPVRSVIWARASPVLRSTGTAPTCSASMSRSGSWSTTITCATPVICRTACLHRTPSAVAMPHRAGSLGACPS